MRNRNYDIDFEIIAKEGKKFISKATQDCEPAMKSAQALRQVDGGKKQYGYHAARIPQLLLHKWGAEDYPANPLCYLQGLHNRIPELAHKLAARMNSNEFQNFRVWGGHVAASDILKEGKKR
jgi:hypothetical protein